MLTISSVIDSQSLFSSFVTVIKPGPKNIDNTPLTLFNLSEISFSLTDQIFAFGLGVSINSIFIVNFNIKNINI